MECQFRVIAWASLSRERQNYGDFISTQCQGRACALWNEHLDVCGLIAEGHLKGLEVERKEAGGFKAP